MMLKIVSLFLIGMAVLAMFGRLRLPGSRKKLEARKCTKCGQYRIGSSGCACESKGS